MKFGKRRQQLLVTTIAFLPKPPLIIFFSFVRAYRGSCYIIIIINHKHFNLRTHLCLASLFVALVLGTGETTGSAGGDKTDFATS